MNDEQIQRLIQVIERLTIEVYQIGAVKRFDDALISAQSFARILDCSVSAIHHGTNTGSIPKPDHKLFEGQKGWRWSRPLVEQFLRSRKLTVPGEAEDLAPAPAWVGLKKARRNRAA